MVEFYAIPDKDIPSGGTLQLTAPPEINVHAPQSCFDVMNNISCKVTLQGKSFTIITSIPLKTNFQVQFQLPGAIDNPISTQPTNSFTLLSSSGDSATDGLQLVATQGTINSILITPAVSVVGGSGNVQINWQVSHIVPQDSYFQIQFPIWNPNDPQINNQKTFLQGFVNCTPIAVLSSKLTCSFLNTTTLLISGGATSTITAGAQISLSISGFKNPMDSAIWSGFKISSMIQTNNIFYNIDSGIGTLQVKDYGSLSLAKLSLQVKNPPKLNGGMIQQADDMQLSFFMPVPLDAGCQVTVVLPTQYNISTVQTVGTFSMFGSYKEFSNSTLIKNNKNNSFTISPCDTYKDNQNLAIIYISKLLQYKYEKTTDSVQIFINNAAGNFVASVQTGVTFSPIRGSTNATAIASNPVVQQATNLTFYLTPQHYINATDQPTLQIQFPQSLSLLRCIVKNVVPSANQSACVKDQFQNQTITIKNFLTYDYNPGDPPIQLTLGEIINPQSTKNVNYLGIQFLAEGKYVIDEFLSSTCWNTTPGTMLSANVNPGSTQAFLTNNVYILKFTPNYTIPQNGYVEIQLPSQIIIPDLSYSQSSCTAPQPQGFPIQGVTCQFQNYTQSNLTGKFTLQILNAFRSKTGFAGQVYSVSLLGVQNPISLMPTGSFIFTTLTPDGYQIEQYTIPSITMITPAEIQVVEILPGNFMNSVYSNFSITIIPTVPLDENNIILITFPIEISLPKTDEEFNCKINEKNLVSSVFCYRNQSITKNQQTVIVQYTLAEKVTLIQSQDIFQFTISQILNPQSTQTTHSLWITILDKTTNATINQKTSGITITTITPYLIQNASVSTENSQPGVQTNYFISFYPEHSIPADGGLLIQIPLQITRASNVSITVSASVSGQTTDQKMINVQYSESARDLLVQNVIQGNKFNPSPSKVINLTIQGFNNPYTDQQTDSFQVSSFLMVQNMYFFIDAAKNGLTIKGNCSYPCNTCVLGQPSNCTSCFQTQIGTQYGLPYLQNYTCVSNCNFGRYYNSQTQQCELCDSKCLSCIGNSQNCLSCGGNDYPYFKNNTCLQSCPAGWLGNKAANQCYQCASQCLTCKDTLSTCTSCNQSSTFALFYDFQCISQCPKQTTVQEGYTCNKCDPSCATCVNSTKQCVKCQQNMKYDPKTMVCTAVCQAETQIYNPNGANGQQECDDCHETCTTCQGLVNKCTGCKPGYVLNKNFTCLKSCDQSQEIKQTPINGFCKDCESPCYDCSLKTNNCTSCQQKPIQYLLLQYLDSPSITCVQYCPSKYNKTSDGMACFYVGLECPVNYTAAADGNSCVPTNIVCASGYEVNEQKTACVPLPGSPIPFPFLITSVFISFLVLGSYLKEKFFTKVYTCLISLIGSLEVIMYLIMVALSLNMGEYAIAVLSIVGLVSMIIANVAFTVYYLRDIYGKDLIFSKWLFFFPKTKKLIPFVSCIFNFKTSKILYSGLYGMESSMAKFGAPLEYYRISRMCQNFSFIFSYGSIFIADFIIFGRVPYGYQLQILGIETFILQILMILLIYFESKKSPAELLSIGSTQYTTIHPKMRSEVRVKSGAGDQDSENSDYDEGVPEIDERYFIRSKEIHQAKEVKLRLVAFQKIIKNVELNHSVVDCDLNQVYTKFDQQHLKLRRAFSMRSRENLSDNEWSVDDLNTGRDLHSYQRDNQDEIRCLLRERRYSWPLNTHTKIEVDKFEEQIDDIMLADDEYLIDNCRKEVKTLQITEIQKQQKKYVSRRTQTYLRELLQIDGFDQNDSDQSIIMDDDAEIDENFAQGLIDDVIQQVSGNEEASDFEKEIDEDSFTKFNKPKEEEIPEFDLADIMGDFEMDELGNLIIVRKYGTHELIDRKGRRVNRKGFLVDNFGNVINSQGQIIFKEEELDEEENIPINVNNEVLIRRAKHTSFQILNEEAPIQAPLQLNQESVNLSPDFQNQEFELDLNVPDDEQNFKEFLNNITQVKVAKKRQKEPSYKVMNNKPPKRFGPNNSGGLYPMINIDNEGQRRLAQLADNIGNQNQTLAMETGRYILESQNSGKNESRYQCMKEQTQNEMVNIDSHRHLLQERPSSVFNGGSKRPLSGKKSSLLRHNFQDKFSLQQVYNNIDQLVGLDQQIKNVSRNMHPKTQIDQRKQTQDNFNKLQAIESTYLNKSASGVRSFKAQPFRPTQQQFDDDPAEQLVDTNMNPQRFHKDQDVSILMAQQIDKIQRFYIKEETNLQAKNQKTMNKMKSSDQDLSEYNLPNNLIKTNNNAVRHDNWLQ